MDKESIYTQISKRIGWKGKAIIPTVKHAQTLHDCVILNDATAFETLFKIYRFANGSANEEEEKAMAIVHMGFKIGSYKFLKKY